MRETALKAKKVLPVLFLVFLFSCSKSGTTQTATPGKPAPNISVVDFQGKPLTLPALRGNIVLVNFWATWCGSCQLEKPTLNAFYKKVSGLPDFRLVTVLYNDTPENAKQYIAQHGYTIPVFSDPGGKTFAAYGCTGVPESYLIDKKGILRDKIIGPINWDSPDVVSYIEKLAKE
ncbi:MAG: TlpA disulfide reductase family protein [Nitrospiraceae bacterium]|nr:TlpA disulfide reductase family protein [Nitrospiraceae bacterium]